MSVPDLLAYERKLWSRPLACIAGVDEVGRGPLAGPVVSAAVIFTQDIAIGGIRDSKTLTENKREALFDPIMNAALAVGIGRVDPLEIDRINIHQAAFKSMRQAVDNLGVEPDHVLVDGFEIPLFHWPQTPVIKGDAKCYTIAAASIIAKVTRDRQMVAWDRQYPEYGFARHKGYCTRQHLDAIRKHGYCPIHRRSFHVKSLEGCV